MDNDDRMTAVSLVAWIERADAQRLFKLMSRNQVTEVETLLDAQFDDVSSELDLAVKSCREAFYEALAYRISPEITDPDAVITEMLPAYERFATDLRAA